MKNDFDCIFDTREIAFMRVITRCNFACKSGGINV